MNIKNEIREMRGLYDKVTTSDLQGIAMVKAIKIIKKNGSLNIVEQQMNHQKTMEAQDIILQYAYGDMDINSANRFLLDIRGK